MTFFKQISISNRSNVLNVCLIYMIAFIILMGSLVVLNTKSSTLKNEDSKSPESDSQYFVIETYSMR